MADDQDESETPRERMIFNIGIAVFLILLVGAGIWIADAMVSTRKLQDCVMSGRKNCAPVQAPDTGTR
jgi:hypothetical protein